jgi:hypothetical protein
MDIILLVRIAIALTFFILAVFGPVAVIQIRRFTRLYVAGQTSLIARVEAIERKLDMHDGVPLP